MTIHAGATLVAVLNPATGRACGVTALGPYEGQRVTWNFKTPGEGIRLSLRTNLSATPGRWTLRASCGQLNGTPPLVARMTVRVLGLGSGHKLLAEHRNLRVRLLPAHHQSGGAPSGAITLKSGGRGGANYDPGDNYPDKWKNAAQDSMVDNWLMDNRECTSWVAWALWDRNGYNILPLVKKYPADWDAKKWGAHARAQGVPVDANPAPGSVAWSDSMSQWGHVAYVTDVKGSQVRIEQYNADFHGHWSFAWVPATAFTGYIHFKDTGINPATYEGHIVKQDNGNVTSWLVTGGHRNWIPDQATYNCLKSKGHPGPDLLSAAQLDQLPDQTGVQAQCTNPFNPAAYEGHIVKQNDGSTTAWLVTGGHRNWIPDQATYNCLKSQGHPGPDLLTPDQLNQLPDQTGLWATCGGGGGGGGGGDKSPPSTPTGFAQIDNSQTAVRVQWNASTDNVGVAGYDLYLNGNLLTSNATSSYVVGGLSCGQSYTLAVDAYDAAGNHSGQATTTGTTLGCTAPPPSVSVSKGAAHTTSTCTSVAYCAYIVVTFSNFGPGSHTVGCYADDPYPYDVVDPFLTYTTSSTTSVYCVYGYPGYHVWAKVDGVESNHYTW